MNIFLIICLESIRDPGNLGTIIRTCDWFGVKDIVCSLDSVDCYNPKVVQSAMGSISRVNITYLDLNNFLKSTQTLKLGTSLKGKSIYKFEIPSVRYSPQFPINSICIFSVCENPTVTKKHKLNYSQFLAVLRWKVFFFVIGLVVQYAGPGGFLSALGKDRSASDINTAPLTGRASSSTKVC